MDVPDIPLSYNLTGVRKTVTPKAFTIPATVSINMFRILCFFGCFIDIPPSFSGLLQSLKVETDITLSVANSDVHNLLLA